MTNRPSLAHLILAGLTALGLLACGTNRGPEWTPATPPPSVGPSIAPGSPGASGSPSASTPASPTASGSPAVASPATSPGVESPAASQSAEPPASGQPSPSAVASPGTGGLPQGSDPITLDPANFVAQITHTYWPMPVGATWTYTEVDVAGTEQRVVVEVTDQTRDIAGITATVVHDQVTEDGELIEDTFDWYAQDAQGNLWYLGEDTKEYEGGEVVSTAGSWEHGVDGAMAGIILPASPAAGMAYRQEYYAGEAEDNAQILTISEFVVLRLGAFEDVIMTRDTTPLEPDILEYKFYAPRVGLVMALSVSPNFAREELIEATGL